MRECQDARVCRKPRECRDAGRCFFVAAMERHLELHPENDPNLRPTIRRDVRPLFEMPIKTKVVCCEPVARDRYALCAPDCVLHQPQPMSECEFDPDHVYHAHTVIEWLNELEEEPVYDRR